MTGASGYTSDSTITGTMSTRSFAFHPNQPSKFQTNTWLNNHARVNMNLSVDEQTSDGDTTPLALSPYSRRKSKNSNNGTDDESSIYSVDTDGYYTSMHTDSGLRGGALPSPPPLPPLPSKDVDFTNTDTICIRKKAVPPPPPKRTSSRPNSIVEASKSDNSGSDTTDSSVQTSESDRDVRDRLRNKTAITSTRYPSMVHVSESEDDSPPIDIKTITYPVSSTTTADRPNTLSLKHVNISEHDVPMLRNPYSLYCDSLMQQKPGLKRSQSMKQEPKSPLGPSKPVAAQNGSPICNSLGRRRVKYPMNVESTVAAQLPMSQKYSTLPTKLRFHPSPRNGNESAAKITQRPLFNSYSLDRRSLRSSRGNSPPMFVHPPSAKTTQPSKSAKIGPAVAPKPKFAIKQNGGLVSRGNKLKKSAMSAQDLFAAIHNSKKKMNITSGPCLSPLSSRCVSPTPSQLSNSSTGTIVAETGFLSPRNVACERRSWAAGSRATPPAAEKKSLAIDRLKHRKPTTINDFKKLLLQTKTSSGHRRSAADMLRATSPVPSPSSSSSKYFRPIAPVPISSPSRSVSPFKRGNRLRSSLPARSLITSPIWEDSCEAEGANGLPVVTEHRTGAYGYLKQSPGHRNCEAILHIPTRSALESSV